MPRSIRYARALSAAGVEVTTAAPAPSEEESSSDGASSKADLVRFNREMAEYNAKYQQYLRDYAAWAEVFGQSPVPPPEKKRRKRRG